MKKKITVKLRQLGLPPMTVRFKIEALTNTASIDINGKHFRCGDELSESQAQMVCEWRNFTVNIS
jgi:hypothetical protein